MVIPTEVKRKRSEMEKSKTERSWNPRSCAMFLVVATQAKGLHWGFAVMWISREAPV